MTATTLGLALAGVAAIATNAAYVVQHDALCTAEPLAHRGVVDTLRALVQSRTWVLGAVLGYAGLAAQIAAMALVPLWVVQATMAGGLIVALGGWARRGRRGDLGRQAIAIGLLGAGVLAVVVGGVGAARTSAVPLIGLGLFVTAAAAAGVVLPHIAGYLPRSSTSAICAGLLYGATTTALAGALSTVVQTPVLAGGILGVGAACAIAGLLRFQRALQAGDAVTVVLLMSAAMNATAMLGGVLVGGGAAPGLVAGAGLVALCGAGFVAALPARPTAVPGGGTVAVRVS